MITLRKSDERGRADHGWLRSYHTFSFASYFDPQHMQFKALRVINEDWIAAGQGFPAHPHDNMEILTYIVSGSLEHKDNVGNGSIIQREEVQLMRAGSGIVHSEFNPSQEETHLLQIWIRPDKKELTPGYQQQRFPINPDAGSFTLLVSPTARDGSLEIHQDVEIYRGCLKQDDTYTYRLLANHSAWMQLISGSLQLNKLQLEAGDGVAIQQERELEMQAQDACEFLFFDFAS